MFSLRSMLSFLFLFWLNKSQAQDFCTWTPLNPSIKENNTVDAVVTTITTLPDVTLQLAEPINRNFSLNGNDLIATMVLDYEETKTQTVPILCTQADVPLSKSIIIIIENINDNPPVFAQSQYALTVKELSPVGLSVGRISATDRDEDRLLYRLDPDTAGFKLQGPNVPDILVQSVLDYDAVKSVSLTLYAQDTRTGAGSPSHTASATILVTIQDIDNRPPWFQPCTPTSVGTAKICVNQGYTGQVNLTVQEVGALSLQPGPVYAIDGDSGINEEITYSFLSGNEAGIFEINPNTGNLTMTKPADVPGPLVLTVLAVQKGDSDKFATATVTLEVVKKSLNPPKFTKSEYEGFISEDAGLGSLVLEGKESTRPLRVQATDEDFADGLNPDVTYVVVGTTDFSATPQGFILLARELSTGTMNLQLRAVDVSNGESSEAGFVMEVTPGIPTTTTTSSTTMETTSSTTMETTSSTTIETTSSTTMETTSSTDMTPTSIDVTSVSTHTSDPSTSDPTLTSQDSLTSTLSASTERPTEGVLGPGGDGYSTGDMAALGVSLAVLLVVCMGVIGLLVFHLQKGKADWRKLSEASIFRNALVMGSSGAKDGVQYTNEGFQKDDDASSTGSHGPEDVTVQRGSDPGVRAEQLPQEQTVLRASSPLHDLLPDSSSLDGSEPADSEKEVKPILTKERKVEEGYKSVWFKEDIDPNAKEEVVIIPDNGEREGDDDDEEEEEEEEEGSLGGGEDEDDFPRSTQRVFFTDVDVESELEGQRNQESDDDEVQTADL